MRVWRFPVSEFNLSLCSSSRLPSRPRFSAGARLLQESKQRLDALRVGEELRERSGAAVVCEVLTARGGVEGAF